MGTRSRKKCQFITKHSLSFVPVDMARLKGEPGRTRHEHKVTEKEGMSMERNNGQQSYNPKGLSLLFWGNGANTSLSEW